jgi:hypothetical protein
MLPIETRNNIDDGRVDYPLVLKDNLEFNELEFKIGPNYSDLANALVNVYGVTTTSSEELEPVYGVVTTVEGFTPPTEQPLDELLVYYAAVPIAYREFNIP